MLLLKICGSSGYQKRKKKNVTKIFLNNLLNKDKFDCRGMVNLGHRNLEVEENLIGAICKVTSRGRAASCHKAENLGENCDKSEIVITNGDRKPPTDLICAWPLQTAFNNLFN